MLFSYIRTPGPFLRFKILNFNIFWDFQKKNEYFLGNDEIVDIFGGHYKNFTNLWGSFLHCYLTQSRPNEDGEGQ